MYGSAEYMQDRKGELDKGREGGNRGGVRLPTPVNRLSSCTMKQSMGKGRDGGGGGIKRGARKFVGTLSYSPRSTAEREGIARLFHGGWPCRKRPGGTDRRGIAQRGRREGRRLYGDIKEEKARRAPH